MESLTNMKEIKTNNDILIAIGSLDEKVETLVGKVAYQNGAVAKLQDKGNLQDVLNAQTTLIHQQIMKQIDALEQINKEKDKGGKTMDQFWVNILVMIGIAVVAFIFKKLGVI